MTYWYYLKVIAYPFLIWGIMESNFYFLLISLVLMTIEDIINWQYIRELQEGK